VDLRDAAARVMGLAQDDRVDEALALAEQSLAAAGDDAPAAELAGLWYAVAVAEHVRGSTDRQVSAAARCLELGGSAREPGWTSNALSMRAMAQVRRGAVELALADLARAEVALRDCVDDGLRNWAHTGLGYCYLELRLYELALPHFEAAVEIVACPLPLPAARTIDLMNLAELHLRWADELERARPHAGVDAEVLDHRALAHRHALDAVAEAERLGPRGMLPTCRATELCSRPRDDAAATVPELREAYLNPGHVEHHGGRATVAAALARTLWRAGQRDEALETAQAAAEHARTAGDWQVAANVQWLLVEMQAEAGIPGAAAGRDYGRLLSGVLWKQRLSTLAGARAALDAERLRHAKDAAQREALEDPLTGVGNRRALEDALRQVQLEDADGEHPTSLLLLDLDAFKAINDRHGHMVGDTVLRSAAAAIRQAARAEDTVARLGGDEFVVLARGTDAEAGARLAERVAEAVNGLELMLPEGPLQLGASVGVRTTGGDLSLDDLLEAADAAMYDVKRRVRPVRG
jgi:diguanylate cyclase (GGDEF)-like protein